MKPSNSRVAFDEIDPFNGNRVRGYLRRGPRRRGDLEITHVNGDRCEQLVYATPKIAPWDPKAGRPPYDRLKLFEKIDGTNILLFRYRDASGGVYVSYKTRLSPFLRTQAYGDYVALWKRILARRARELEPLLNSPYAFGFELFGRSLRILTDYETELDARLLYALDPASGEILDPEADPAWTFATPRKLGEYGPEERLSAVHEELMEKLTTSVVRGEPIEGAVLYFVRGGVASLAKCKPALVMDAQARYRELYGYAKSLVKTGADPGTVLDGLSEYVDTGWSEGTRTLHGRVIEIVREDVTKELEFAGPSPVQSGEDAGESVDHAILGQTILWETVWGSHLWGMATPGSDVDRFVVYQLDDRTVQLGAFEPRLLAPHRTGWRRHGVGLDEHWFELGRVVQLILQGSLTALYGVMSPLGGPQTSAAQGELRALLESSPSRVCYRGLISDVDDSEKAIQRASGPHVRRKHLRIACRNLQFGITLFSQGRYEFRPSAAEHTHELEALRREASEAYRASLLPVRFDPEPFRDYLIRWRRRRAAQPLPRDHE